MSRLTEKAICDSFLKLLEERPFAKIKVKDIVEDCGINRNSFYYHFQDIPSLLERIIQEDCDRIIREYPRLDSFSECLDMAFRFVYAHKKAAMHIYESVNRDVFEDYLWRLSEYAITRYLDTVLAGRAIRGSDRDLLVRYMVCECFGIAMGMVREGMKELPAEDLERLKALRLGQAEQMIERCVKDAAN